ncbi:unnamed protein product [Adineta ricciae]|uniref:NAD(P)(+)--arginine ADP-ribosyltransferase n=1 Tax=Adineta ricciae TaxID=249248 RepID=A0A814HV44_ADIRI|nr:unnamed protein product [Adineta ricciae]CAF1035652.1 unnamed protein product [Adineta ricciae]
MKSKHSNFLVILLHSNIDEQEEKLEYLSKHLQRYINSIKTFTDIDNCIDYVTDLIDTKVFLILSDHVVEHCLTLIENIPQIYSIYHLSNQTDETLCNNLIKDMYQFQENSIPITIIPNENLHSLDPSFMYIELLKEILLQMKFDQKSKDEFVNMCLIKEVEYETSHRIIDEFDHNYKPSLAIQWYTRDCFIYRMLNDSLRYQDTDVILTMGFFIRDLHRQIELLYQDFANEKPSIVYRGQGMFNNHFERLRENKGGLLSFNHFLSTTCDQELAYVRACSAQDDSELTGVFFEMHIDLSIQTTPFASLDKVSYYGDREKEILFSINTIFRIHQIEQMDERLYKVKLFLTSDNDPELNKLTDHIRHEMICDSKSGQLAYLLVKMNNLNKAEEICQKKIELPSDYTTMSDDARLHNIIGYIKTQQNDLNSALIHLFEGLKKRQEILPPDHIDLAASYNNIGELYHTMGQLSNALDYHSRARSIWEKHLEWNDSKLAKSYNNLGEVYRSMGENASAFMYHKKALVIYEKTLPPTHPDLAMSHNNIGLVYRTLGQNSLALQHLQKASEILQKSVQINHPSLALILNNIGELHTSMGEYQKALTYHEKARKIQEKSLEPDHPDVASSHNYIALVHFGTGRYLIALMHFSKAMNIYYKSLPSTHPDFIEIHMSMGLLYYFIKRHSLSLLHFQKALQISRISLPTNHQYRAIIPQVITTIQRDFIKFSLSNNFSFINRNCIVIEDELD